MGLWIRITGSGRCVMEIELLVKVVGIGLGCVCWGALMLMVLGERGG